MLQLVSNTPGSQDAASAPLGWSTAGRRCAGRGRKARRFSGGRAPHRRGAARGAAGGSRREAGGHSTRGTLEPLHPPTWVPATERRLLTKKPGQSVLSVELDHNKEAW